MGNGPAHVAAVIDRTYLPHARVLADSLAAHHPDRRLTVLVIDGADTAPDEPFDLLVPADLAITAQELHRRALLYDTQGVISSLRPRLVAQLLARGGSVLLLDADMEVLAPIDDLWALAQHAGVVLSPHTIEPLAGRAGAWPEEELLRSGTFNGGLLGVGPGGGDFLTWLTARTERDCLRDPARGLLYSQTWLDLVPALFEHAIVRDRGVNAMVHNLRGRDVDWGVGGARVAGVPLRLFHYSGFDPADPQRLCRYYPDGFASLDGRPGLARLARAYADRLRERGWPTAPGPGWASLPDGTPVDDAMRSTYRRALLSAEAGVGVEPPDPFHPGGDFTRWLGRPVVEGLSRYLLELRTRRADLVAAFPRVPGSDSARYLEWARTSCEVAVELIGVSEPPAPSAAP